MDNQRRNFFKKLGASIAGLGLGAKAIKAENYEKTYKENSIPIKPFDYKNIPNVSGTLVITGCYNLRNSPWANLR